LYKEFTERFTIKRAVAQMREKRNAFRILVGTPEGKRPLGRPRRMWMENVKMDLREIGLDRDQWRALVNTLMNLWVP
jgi:hypothetical protein